MPTTEEAPRKPYECCHSKTAARQKAQALKIISADAMHHRAPGRPTPRNYYGGTLAMTDLSRTPVTLIGASRGLGRVLAETFHRLGAQVLVVARGQAGLDAVARDLPGVAVLACGAAAAPAPDPPFARPAPRPPVPRGGARPPTPPRP